MCFEKELFLNFVNKVIPYFQSSIVTFKISKTNDSFLVLYFLIENGLSKGLELEVNSQSELVSGHHYQQLLPTATTRCQNLIRD